MDYNMVEEFESLVERELRKITDKGDVTPIELENATKAVCLLEKLDHYMSGEPEDKEFGGASMTGSRRYQMPSRNSYARGRNPMTGRYTSRDGGNSMRYSRNSYDGNSYDGDDMLQHLESMRDTAATEQERMAIDECIRKIMK